MTMQQPDCRFTHTRLWEYLRGELGEKDQKRIRIHLEQCATCRKESDSCRETLALFSVAKDIPLPTFRVRWPQIEERLSAPRSVFAWLSWRRALVGTTLVTAALVLLVIVRPAGNIKQTTATPIPAILSTSGLTAFSTAPSNGKPALPTGLAPQYTERTIAQRRSEIVESRPRILLPQIARQRERPVIATTVTTKPAAIPGLKAPMVPTTPVRDDLDFINPDISAEMAAPTPWPSDELRKREKEMAGMVVGGDDFVSVPLPQLAGAGTGTVKAALAAYQQEKEIVDTRLVRTITLAVKAASFAELCDRLTSETGITFTVNRRVADDNVTIFCTKRPLRDMMREIGRHFSFTWLRTGTEGAYCYELTQTLSAQLLEESLRQKDRDEMLLALDRQMEWYRPYAGMTPAQIQEKMDALSPLIKDNRKTFDEWAKLSNLLSAGLMGARQFFRLSTTDMDTLRSGKELQWDLIAPANGPRPDYLPEASALNDFLQNALTNFDGTPKFQTPPKRLSATLKLETRPIGQYTLKGGLNHDSGGTYTVLAEATSPSKTKLDNAALNASLRENPDFQKTVTLTVKPTCELKRHPYPEFDEWRDGPRALAADVLEALHEATGKDIIGDQFLRLQFPDKVAVKDRRLFDALNQIGDAMQVRWTRSEGWLRFRTPDYYNARPQEVPKRLLSDWQEKRKKRKILTLEELVEIGTLSDTQLDSPTTAQAAIGYYELTEWPLARSEQARPHWRFLAQLPEEQREEAFGEKGLAFTELRPSHRQRYVELSECNTGTTLPSLKEASLRILYGPTFGNYLPANNGVIFFYKFGPDHTNSAIGPFNAIIRLP